MQSLLRRMSYPILDICVRINILVYFYNEHFGFAYLDNFWLSAPRVIQRPAPLHRLILISPWRCSSKRTQYVVSAKLVMPIEWRQVVQV
jgi:hypothetical protein